MTTKITIEGLPELLGRLDNVEKTITTLNTTVEAVMREGQTSAATYPPSTEANSPSNPSGRWYERGYGPKWQTQSGVHGRKTSQTLSKKWYVKGRKTGVEVGNTASYASAVHGDDALPIHKSRGWKNLTDQLVQRMPKLEQLMTEIVQRAMGGS